MTLVRFVAVASTGTACWVLIAFRVGSACLT
jgi:hypothetical protein